MSFPTNITMVGFVVASCFVAQSNAQQVVTYFAAPNAYSVQRITTFAQPVVVQSPVFAQQPVFVQQPMVAAPTTVVVNRPVLRPFAPTVVTTFSPVVMAPTPVAVTQFAPVPITTTRHRPILGGTVQRTRVGYAPVTTIHGW